MQDDIAIIIKQHFKEYKHQLRFLGECSFSFANRCGFHPITRKRTLVAASPDEIELRLLGCVSKDDAVLDTSIAAFAQQLRTLVLRDHRVLACTMLLSSPDATIQSVLQPDCAQVLVEWCMDAMMEQDVTLLNMCLDALSATLHFPGSSEALLLNAQAQRWLRAQMSLEESASSEFQQLTGMQPSHADAQMNRVRSIQALLKSLQVKPKGTATAAAAPKPGESRLSTQRKEQQEQRQEQRLQRQRQLRLQEAQAQKTAGVKRTLPQEQLQQRQHQHQQQQASASVQRQPKKLSKTSDVRRTEPQHLQQPQPQPQPQPTARKPTGIFDQPRARPTASAAPVAASSSSSSSSSSSLSSSSSSSAYLAAVLATPLPPPPPPPPPLPSLEDSRRKIRWADEVGKPLVRDDEPLPRCLLSLPPSDEVQMEHEGKADFVEGPASQHAPAASSANSNRNVRELLEEEKKNERERLVEERRNRQRQLEQMKPQMPWSTPARLALAGEEVELSRQAINTQAMQQGRLEHVEEVGAEGGNDDADEIPDDPTLHPSAGQPASDARPPINIVFEAIEILPDFLRAMPPAQLQNIVDNRELLESCRLPNGKLDGVKLQAKVNELLEKGKL